MQEKWMGKVSFAINKKTVGRFTMFLWIQGVQKHKEFDGFWRGLAVFARNDKGNQPEVISEEGGPPPPRPPANPPPPFFF